MKKHTFYQITLHFLAKFKNLFLKIMWIFRGRKKILIFNEQLSWINLDFYRLSNLFLNRRYILHRVKCPFNLRKHGLEISEENFKDFSYKGVNLYDVSIYGICVEAETYPCEISFSNPNHKRRIEEWYERSACCVDYVENLLKKNNICKNVIFQGYFYDSAIVKSLAIRQKLFVITIEVTSNKNKLLWDNVSAITVNKNMAENYFWRYEKFIEPLAAEHYVNEYINNIHEIKIQDHSSPVKEFIKKTSRPLIVFIGQVYTDASVLFGINAGFKEPVEIIESLAEYAASNDFELAVKLHPKEAGGLNTITSRPYEKITWRKICNNSSLKAKIESSGNITVDHDNLLNTYSMLNNADVVVTINSQAGLEALALGKNVILCGQCFYGNIGSTFNAQNTNMLKAFLDMVLKEKITLVDKTKIDKFFYIYFEKYCIDKNESAVRDLILRKL